MSQNLQNFVKFQKFQLENLVDFEKCCKTHIFLQKSEPIQPKTSNILPKFCQPTLSDVSAVRSAARSQVYWERTKEPDRQNQRELILHSDPYTQAALGIRRAGKLYNFFRLYRSRCLQVNTKY